MKTLLLISALLVCVTAQAGVIAGNVGFTVYEDASAWAAAHPNATSISLSGTVTGSNGTDYSSEGVAITGTGLGLGYLGLTPAIFADPTSGVAVQLMPVSSSAYAFAFHFTPLPSGTYQHIVMYSSVGNDLDYYAYTGGPFFLGVTSANPIVKIVFQTPYGGTYTAQAIALDSLQQDQAETPEPATKLLFLGPALLLLILQRKP